MLALVNGRLYTMKNGTIKDGVVLIEGGKIVEVGRDVSVPEGAQVIDVHGSVVMPGIIDAHVHAGIGEEGIGFEGRDYNESVNPVTPELRAVDAVNPEDEGIKDAVKGGVTAFCTGPGSANVIGGTCVVMKTHGTVVDDMVVREPAGMKVAFGENPKRTYSGQKKTPTTRMGIAALLRSALVKAQAYMEKWERFADQPDKRPDRDLGMEALCRVIRREIPLRAHAHRADDILTALRIAREFGVDVVIEHCTEGHKIAEVLAEQEVPAIVGPTLTARTKYELREKTFATPAILHKAGVKVALMTDHPVIPLQYLLVAAALCVKAGLPSEVALEAITIRAAEILGVADRLGSLEPGKDADIAVFSGDPLDIRSKVEKVFCDGQLVYTVEAN